MTSTEVAKRRAQPRVDVYALLWLFIVLLLVGLGALVFVGCKPDCSTILVEQPVSERIRALCGDPSQGHRGEKK